MQKKLIFLLVFMVLITVFALQNSMEVSIKLWLWTAQTSMALILILTFAFGAIAGILFSLSGKSKRSAKKSAPITGTPSPDINTIMEPADEVPLEVKDPNQDDEFEDIDS